LKSRKKLDNDQIIDQLSGFVLPLMEPDKEADSQIQPYEFEEEQQTVAKLLHLIDS